MINNLKIIGIHRGYEKEAKKNVGKYFKEIINYIKNNKDIYEKIQLIIIIIIQKL